MYADAGADLAMSGSPMSLKEIALPTQCAGSATLGEWRRTD